MLKDAGAVRHRIHDLFVGDDGADGHIAAAQTLGDGDQVGRDAEVIDGEGGAGAAEAGDDLVAAKKNVIFIADFPYALKVFYGRHGSSGGRAR